MKKIAKAKKKGYSKTRFLEEREKSSSTSSFFFALADGLLSGKHKPTANTLGWFSARESRAGERMMKKKRKGEWWKNFSRPIG